MRKVIVAVAPVNPDIKEVDSPFQPREVADDVIASARTGASLVHLHVRNEKGVLTDDLGTFSRTIDLIKQESDIIVQGSTGGLSSLSLDERCISLKDERVEMASLNMGSINMGEDVYINKFSDIRHWARRMKEVSVKPEMEIFEAGMINNAKILHEEGIIEPEFNFGFCLGVKGALPADAYQLCYLKEQLPEGSNWGIIHHGMNDLSLLATAIGMGADMVRVGFEDSIYYAPGKKAESNKVLVEKVVRLINDMGLEVATPEEAREILDIS